METLNQQREIFQNHIKNFKLLLKNTTKNHDSIKALSWLNDLCFQLTNVCGHLHKILIIKEKWTTRVMEEIFLCLQQLICCINFFERIITTERNNNEMLKFCRQHYSDRMYWSLDRLVEIVRDTNLSDTLIESEITFATNINVALELLTPISIYSSQRPENSNQLVKSNMSVKIREKIELLMAQTMTIINVVEDDSDRLTLKTTSNRIMNECINFQIKCKTNVETEIRFKAQQLVCLLQKLEKTIIESLFRAFLKFFSEFPNTNLHNIRTIRSNGSTKNDVINQEIAKIDNGMDLIIQIGSFVCAYALDVKTKTHLRSSLASLEALSTYLIPSVLSPSTQKDSMIFEKEWNQSINSFRKCTLAIMNSDAFALLLIEHFNESLNSTVNDMSTLSQLMKKCIIFSEHIEMHSKELNIHLETPLKLYYDDFKMMLNECHACLSSNISFTRIKKRFHILLNTVKNIAKILNAKEMREGKELEEEMGLFTIHDVTSPFSTNKRDKEMLDRLTNVNEFISKNRIANNELTNQNTIFYDSFKKMGEKTTTKLVDNTLDVRKHNPKGCSKRTSLRVAMFKKQKFMETQRFFNSFDESTDPFVSVDSINLQITNILEKLSIVSTQNNQ